MFRQRQEFQPVLLVHKQPKWYTIGNHCLAPVNFAGIPPCVPSPCEFVTFLLIAYNLFMITGFRHERYMSYNYTRINSVLSSQKSIFDYNYTAIPKTD